MDAARHITATNALDLAQQRCASISLSRASDSATNGVVYFQAKNAAGVNLGRSVQMAVWCSTNAITGYPTTSVPDDAAWDYASMITCGTEILSVLDGGHRTVISDGDGKVSWAIVTTALGFTNYFHATVGDAPVSSITMPVPME